MKLADKGPIKPPPVLKGPRGQGRTSDAAFAKREPAKSHARDLAGPKEPVYAPRKSLNAYFILLC
jgi:hypothetical protein